MSHLKQFTRWIVEIFIYLFHKLSTVAWKLEELMCSRHLSGQWVYTLRSNRRNLGFSSSSLLIHSVNEKLILPSFPLLLSHLIPHSKKRNTKNIINYLLSEKPKNCEQNVYCKRLISNFYSKRNVTKTWCIYRHQSE